MNKKTIKNKEARFEIGKLLLIGIVLSVFLFTLIDVSALLIGGREGGYFNGTIDEVMILVLH